MTPEPQKIITTGHAGFALRHTWLKKARDVGDKGISSEDATIRLGVGKNMVQSVRYYAKLCGLFDNEVNNFGKYNLSIASIIDNANRDPYLEYTETIWLIHHKLATNSALLSYYNFFNFFNQTIFNNEVFKGFLRDKITEQNVASFPAEETLKRDVDCFIANYASKKEDKPTDSFGALLQDLNLIKTNSKGIHQRIYQKAFYISDSIFSYVLSQFWREEHFEKKVLSLQALSQDPKSPGKILQMQEEEVHKKLETLNENKNMPIEKTETAGIVNITLKTDARHLASEAVKEVLQVYEKA